MTNLLKAADAMAEALADALSAYEAAKREAEGVVKDCLTTDDVVERCAKARFEMTSDVRWRDLTKHDQEAEMIAMKIGLRALRPGDELPGGLVVVGKVPTEKMLKAGSDEFTIGASFRAMLAAAKEPPRE